MARQALAEKKLLAAICIAPLTLARAGLLENEQSTCWPGVKEEMKKAGVDYVKSKTVVTRMDQGCVVVTASGPESAEEFGRKILELLLSGGEKSSQ